MTAHSTASGSSPLGTIEASLSSLNRPVFDVNVNLPPELSSLEYKAVKWTEARVKRGALQLRVNFFRSDNTMLKVKANTVLAEQIQEAVAQIAKKLNLDCQEPLLYEILSKREDLITLEETDEEKNAHEILFKETLFKAVDQLLQMKVEEGKHLQKDIEARLESISQSLDHISSYSKDVVSVQKENLTEKIREVSEAVRDNEERILREIVIFAQKMDINEEIVRSKSHIQKMRQLIQSDAVLKGKTLEFLTQELFREANTIASKTPLFSVTHEVVNIKTEIERIKEQVRNVE